MRVINGAILICGCQHYGSFFGYPKYEVPYYYNRDPKRDHNFDNHPYDLYIVLLSKHLPTWMPASSTCQQPASQSPQVETQADTDVHAAIADEVRCHCCDGNCISTVDSPVMEDAMGKKMKMKRGPGPYGDLERQYRNRCMILV